MRRKSDRCSVGRVDWLCEDGVTDSSTSTSLSYGSSWGGVSASSAEIVASAVAVYAVSVSVLQVSVLPISAL